jgi:hypothetical protein
VDAIHCIVTLMIFLAAAPSALAARALPPIAGACDLADWRSAQIGRAKLPADLGITASDGLLVVAGGAFTGADLDPKQHASKVVALIDAAGFDVVNLAARDLVGDPAALGNAINSSKAKFISASFSLLSGAPWKPFTIIERGGKKIAVIGIASQSKYIANPIPGLQYIEPADAIKKAIADSGTVDGIVLLADAPLADAATWIKQFPQIDGLIVSGRGGGGAVIDSLPRALRVPPGGDALAALPSDASKPGFAINLDAPIDPSEGYKQVASKYPVAPAPARLEGVTPPPPPAPPTKLTEGKLAPLGATGSNRAATVTVQAAGILDSLAGHPAPAGKRYLVLDVQFRNILTPQIVRDEQVPVAYLLKKLSDHLYLIADHRRVLPPVTAAGVAGQLSTGEMMLPRGGSTDGGKLIYEIDASKPPAELVLRLYDFAHGHVVLPIILPAGASLEQTDKPASPLVKNEVIEAGNYGLQTAKQFAGKTAPDGMQFVIVDLRARSVLTMDADATAFDPKASPGQRIKVGTVADWTEARAKYLTMVVDGQYGYTSLPGGTLPDQPRFLPDIATGGDVAFLVPDKAQSLELRCDFPNAKTPDGQMLHPEGLIIALHGKRPSLPNPKPLASIQDDVFTVDITNQQSADSFAGIKADSGKRFIILDVTVKNGGQKGEFFQTSDQLKLASASGQQLTYDKATDAGIHHPYPLVWIPSRQQRSFQVAYQLDATETQPRLAYAGVSKADVIALPRLAPMAMAQAPEAPAPAPAQPQPQPQSGANPSPQAKAQADADAKPQANAVADATPHQQQSSTPPPAPSPIPAPAPAPAEPQNQFIEANGQKFPASVPIHPNLTPKGLAGVGLTPDQVNAAIDRGSAFLWHYIQEKDLKNDRAFGSDQCHVLAALALVHSGAQKKFPEFNAGLRKYLASFDPNDVHDTYQVGLYCMLVEAYGDPSFIPQMKASARWLIETQGPQGTWNYGNSLDPKLFAQPADLRVLRVAGGRPLDGSDVAKPISRQTPAKEGRDGDNSNTQYALLGLSSASRSRIPADPLVWQHSLKEQEARQSTDDGGWAYSSSGGSYGSMTSAGICDLAVISHALGQGSDPAIQHRIERGLAWLSANFSVTKHPNGSDGWLYYYLYSLERVGRILDTEFIGDHEWYPLGAQSLVGKQKADGSWIGTGSEDDPRLATSFALLFLTRATSTLEAPKYTGPGTLTTNVLLPAGRQLYIILDASGSMLENMDGKPKFDIAKDAIASIVKELPANSQVALRVYGYRKRAIEEGADEDSKLLIPMGQIDKEKMFQLLAGLRARGKTPLAYSLDQALGEIPQGTADAPVTLLLLTDGGEDAMPRRDPVAAAAKYAALPNLHFRIVGFDINRSDWSSQLQAMATAAHGIYLPASRGPALLKELHSAVFETPDGFALTDQNQKQVASGQFGDSIKLQAGKYDIHATYGGRAFDQTIWINAGTTTAVTFDASAVTPGAGTPIPQGAAPVATPSAPVAVPAPSAPVTAAPAPGATPAPAAAPKFCTHCGAPLPAGAKFCPKCGTPVPGA